MNIDIRLSVGFWRHPKVRRLEKALGLRGIRSLQILWCWAAEFRPGGLLYGMDSEDIEFAADWRGKKGAFFAQCLGAWLEESAEGYVLRQWAEHNPWQAANGERCKAKSENGRKAAISRWTKAEGEKPCEPHATACQPHMRPHVNAYAESMRPHENAYATACQTHMQPHAAASQTHMQKQCEPHAAACQTHMPPIPVPLPEDLNPDFKKDFKILKLKLNTASPCGAADSSFVFSPHGEAQAPSPAQEPPRPALALPRPEQPEAPEQHEARARSQCEQKEPPEPPQAPPGEDPPQTARPKGKKGARPQDCPHYQAKSGRFLTGQTLADFSRFWTAFDFMRGKAEAADAWLDIQGMGPELADLICQAASQEAAARDSLMAKGRSPKWAQGWLSARRWEDYDPPPPRPDRRVRTMADIVAEMEKKPSEEQWRKAQETRRALEKRRREKRGGMAL